MLLLNLFLILSNVFVLLTLSSTRESRIRSVSTMLSTVCLISRPLFISPLTISATEVLSLKLRTPAAAQITFLTTPILQARSSPEYSRWLSLLSAPIIISVGPQKTTIVVARAYAFSAMKTGHDRRSAGLPVQSASRSGGLSAPHAHPRLSRELRGLPFPSPF
jgi:hypothetical protein